MSHILLPRNRSARRHEQRAQTVIEFILIFPVMLLLLFGALQFALIYKAKTTLNYATFIAARAATLNNGKREQVNQAFSRGLSPLYVSFSSGSNVLEKVEAVHAAREKVLGEIQAGGIVCMERLNPINEDFGYEIPNHPDVGGPAIPVDNLVYRESTITSGAHVSIQDATLFKLKVTYCYQLYVPYLNTVIPKWFLGDPEEYANDPDATYQPHLAGIGSFKQSCIANRSIPLTSVAIMRMQSAVVNEAYVPAASGSPAIPGEGYETAAQCS
ncbi:MAG: hypothetical protein BMS9Abin26_1483 [Gammaproteobacteria bacterium]|nr:MAG: hypothetical protein BMS9Abin26_1483 [Gammaproteobacteria bacterium]